MTSLDDDMPTCGRGEPSREVYVLRDRVRAAAQALKRRLDLGDLASGVDDGQNGDVTGRGGSSSSSGTDGPTGGGDIGDEEDALRVTIDELCNEIEAVETRATAQLKVDEERKWREWISEGIDQGASRAHSYSRLRKAWTPSTVQMPDGTISSSVDDLMNEQRQKYRQLWKPADRPFRYVWNDEEELPAMDADQLRQAAGTFATRTSSTYDGFHPRMLGNLSGPSLDTLGVILAAVERSGIWPRQVSLIVATLLPKPTGGFRPIGLAPAVYRLWSKARRSIADEWEQRHRRPFFAACSGNGPLDTLWRMTARQEAGVATGETAAAVSEDLQAFFEHIDRDLLLAEAAALGFPIPIVRAALAAYSSARMLAMGGRMSREMYPTIGVIAGCSLAMVLTKIYCVRALDDFVKKAPPGVKLDTFVDDFTISMVGKPQVVADSIEEAHGLLKDIVIGTLRCRFADEKNCNHGYIQEPGRGDLSEAGYRRGNLHGGDATGCRQRRRRASCCTATDLEEI